MALPPRTLRRRGGSQRWLVIPLLLTMLVLLADASMHARSAGLQTTLSSQAWVDRVLPDIADSTVQGREIAELSSGPLTVGPEAVAEQLSRVAAAATTTYDQVVSAEPPAAMNAAAGLLDACMAACRRGRTRWPAQFRTSSKVKTPPRYCR